MAISPRKILIGLGCYFAMTNKVSELIKRLRVRESAFEEFRKTKAQAPARYGQLDLREYKMSEYPLSMAGDAIRWYAWHLPVHTPLLNGRSVSTMSHLAMLSCLEIVNYEVKDKEFISLNHRGVKEMARLSKFHNTEGLTKLAHSGFVMLEDTCKAVYVASVYELTRTVVPRHLNTINPEIPKTPLKFDYSPEFFAIIHLLGNGAVSDKKGCPPEEYEIFVPDEHGEKIIGPLMEHYYPGISGRLKEILEDELRLVFSHARASMYKSPELTCFFDAPNRYP